MQVARRLPGEVTACPGCSRQPFHVHHRGKDLHSMECPRCGITTARFITTQQSVEAWEAQATTHLPNRAAA